MNKNIFIACDTKSTNKAKKIINDDAGQQVRKMFSINERDDFVWTKVRDRHLDADVNLLKTKIN